MHARAVADRLHTIMIHHYKAQLATHIHKNTTTLHTHALSKASLTINFVVRRLPVCLWLVSGWGESMTLLPRHLQHTKLNFAAFSARQRRRTGHDIAGCSVYDGVIIAMLAHKGAIFSVLKHTSG